MYFRKISIVWVEKEKKSSNQLSPIDFDDKLLLDD